MRNSLPTSTRDSRFDVTGIGSISIDFIGTAEAWPPPGGKVPLSSFSVQGGGVIATALSAVSRLGGSARFAGVLGYSEMAVQALETLKRDGVDTSLVLRRAGAEPIRAFVFSDTTSGERTIFFTRDGVEYPDPEEFPDTDWFRTTRTLLVSAGAGNSGLKMAQAAQCEGLPVILDAEHVTPLSKAFLQASDYIVVPWTFASAYTGSVDLDEATQGLWLRPRQFVVITLGDQGCSTFDGNILRRFPAIPVETIDTTGCGDVFHGAFALAVARKEPIEQACRFASAAAALCATRLGGRAGIPNRETVEDLLRRSSGGETGHQSQ